VSSTLYNVSMPSRSAPRLIYSIVLDNEDITPIRTYRGGDSYAFCLLLLPILHSYDSSGRSEGGLHVKKQAQVFFTSLTHDGLEPSLVHPLIDDFERKKRMFSDPRQNDMILICEPHKSQPRGLSLQGYLPPLSCYFRKDSGSASVHKLPHSSLPWWTQSS
jgi:hypothetical protein